MDEDAASIDGIVRALYECISGEDAAGLGAGAQLFHEMKIWCARRDSNAGPLAPEALDGGLLLPTPAYRTRRIRRFRPRPFGSSGMVRQGCR